MNMVKGAKSLIDTCEHALAKHECRIPAIKSVRNLSRSDLDSAVMYAQAILQCGDWRHEFMEPRGAVRELLWKFGLV